MPSEQLIQNELLDGEGLKGHPFGKYEKLKIGATTVEHLVKAGLVAQVRASITYPFASYKAPRKAQACKPDNVIIRRVEKTTHPVAIEEYKKPAELKTTDGILKALEQGLFAGAALDVKLAVITDGAKVFYINVPESLRRQELVYFKDTRKFSPGVLEELLCEKTTMRDPADLAEKVWQMIWHATKEEPKPCLLTFVEMFVLKFLSDNLPLKILPKSRSFYELLSDPIEFHNTHGCTPIEHYINVIRPAIKQIFPDNTIAKSKSTAQLFGLETVISKTSIINGFSFMKNSSSSPATFNRVFVDILRAFNDFGPLTSIDPEFKLRLYETFLKKTAGQQKLGQFFTPRNVVKPIIKMARMSELADGAVVLDPACGVGGFVLEPLITEPTLAANIAFQNGIPQSTIKLIGVDVDASTHILAKANLLIHLVELVRDPSVTTAALNQLMAETLVLMNDNETLGSLEHPPKESVDLIMTNPPYVTNGSGIYKDELRAVNGKRNELILSDYYDKMGLGLESLFLRYISGALKPGGRAFVIVPQGMLSRSETSTKETVLSECNLIASIALPSNTFFNTPQKTYIIALEKRHSDQDSRPAVLCAIARSIGESLDSRRVPVPENDLSTIAEQFVEYSNKLQISREKKGAQCPYEPTEAIVKLVKADQFTKNDRWDSARLWSSDELVDLGVMESAIGRLEFVEEAKTQLPSLLAELEQAKRELAILTTVDAEKISLDNPAFTLRRGKRVTKKTCGLNPGDEHDLKNLPTPVYSGSNIPTKALGYVGSAWLKDKGITIENLKKDPLGVLTINSNGSVGMVFIRYQPCVIHDDVTVIQINRPDINIEYLATQLRSSVAEGNFEYEAKLYVGRIKELVVTIPVNGNKYDLEKQIQIADAYKRFDVIKSKLEDFGKWAASSRMKNDNEFRFLDSSIAMSNDD
jgi:type I restriction-modification system DNA methylase subunit